MLGIPLSIQRVLAYFSRAIYPALTRILPVEADLQRTASCFFEAARNRHTPCIQLLKRRGASLNMPRMQQALELCRTVAAADAPVLESFLLAGMDAAAADYDGRTALHLACGEGNGAMVRLLLRYREHASADPVLARDRWGHTPIDEAKERGYSNIVATLQDGAASVAPGVAGSPTGL